MASSSVTDPPVTTAASASAAPKGGTQRLIRRWYIELSQPRYDTIFLGALLVCEFLLGTLIITKVPYTEIDWIAYMQEVDGWYIDGHYDYIQIRGDTGPLVYPAGFLYLFRGLQWLTGRQIPSAQRIFLILYLATQFVMLTLYTKVLRHDITATTSPTSPATGKEKQKDDKLQLQQCHRVWSFRLAMGCLCLSKRFHSIFLLRLFNDGPTMLVAYISFWCFVSQQWNLGCFIFSIAVSLKMNVLLFAPGLLYLLIETNPSMTIPRLMICGITQLILGAPFLLRHPISYLRKAFELDRQFFFKWTVNLKFLPENIFLSKAWAVLLLVGHVSLLLVFHYHLYQSTYNNKNKTASSPTKATTIVTTSPQHILMTLFVSNFIGICCARTLHYQFYSWYFSSLPLLLWRSTRYPILVRICLLGMIEYAFLTFPATPTSSMCLQLAHWLILIPCIMHAGTDPTVSNKTNPKKNE
jgi:alpha-1,3-mannosyltransferase